MAETSPVQAVQGGDPAVVDTLIDVSALATWIGPGQATVRVLTLPSGEHVAVLVARLFDTEASLAQARARDTRDGPASRYAGRVKLATLPAQLADTTLAGGAVCTHSYSVTVADSSAQGRTAFLRAARVAAAKASARTAPALLRAADAEVRAQTPPPPPPTRAALRAQFARGELTDGAFAALYATASE